jgi:hypothetical protein
MKTLTIKEARKLLIKYCIYIFDECKEEDKATIDEFLNTIKETVNQNEGKEPFRIYKKCAVCGCELPDNYITNVCYGCD